ncbi:uncharacterized protein LOC119732370 [Patiria miniata]|uniref:Uncharacterized protein n=1 Tax=Patiria miniata TaxID=46514 RepID=A0A914AEG7_PATMI|nr:uncharacterized protein LOC119732370 [Patiria miniata]
MESILVESAEILRTFTASWNHILATSRNLSRNKSVKNRDVDTMFGSRKDDFLHIHAKELVIADHSEPEKNYQPRTCDLRSDPCPPKEKLTKDVDGNMGEKRAAVYTQEATECNLTMDVIGCLPDNVQQAIKSFSIKKETEHLILSFPFMTDILRKACLLDNASTTTGRHVTPMILSDHSLKLTKSHQAIVTLAPDNKRSTLRVVQFTIYRSGTKEGLSQHYAQLLSSMLKDLPAKHFRFPHFVVLDNSTDPMMIASLCNKIRKSIVPLRGGENSNGHAPLHDILRYDDFSVSGLQNGIFHRAVDETMSYLTDQDRERFLVLIKHLLSEKCLSQEFKKTEQLLRNHDPVPAAIRDFWMIWGHELVKPFIFPVARVIWDCEDQDDGTTRPLSWRALFKPPVMTSDEGVGEAKHKGVMKGIIQGVVQRLRGQIQDASCQSACPGCEATHQH